jgi:hypothetical protein
VLEVAGPSSQHLVELVQQDGEWLVSVLPGERPELRLDRCQRLLGRVGVDVALARASLWVPLDPEPEKVEALVDVDDPRFRLRQAKAHRGKLRCDLLTQRLGMGTAAGHQHDEIVGVADQPPGRQPFASMPLPRRRGGAHGLPCPGEVLIQDRQGQVAEQR